MMKPRYWAVLFTLAVLPVCGQMFQRSLPFLAKSGGAATPCETYGMAAYDDFEGYTVGQSIGGQSGGCGFAGAFVTDYDKIIAYDSMESYTKNYAVNGLNGGIGWGTPYGDRIMGPPTLIEYDNMEDYTLGEQVDGLIDGRGWMQPYVDRANPFGIKSYDSMESYSVSDPVNDLNGGSGWNSPYRDR